MAKISIYEQEQAFFNEWPEHDSSLFCKDGLHFTGEASKDSGFWLMDHRDYKEEQKWFDSPIRCLFLTKDHNLQGDKEGVDFRTETGLDNVTDNVYYYFYARYLQLLYGLMHIDTTTFDYPPLEVAKNVDTYLEYFYEAPVVRMNMKKTAGGSQCPADVLATYLKNNGDFTKRQIAMYDANIIVVCQGSDWDINADHSNAFFILDMLYQQYPDMKQWCDCVYYSEKAKTVFLHEWHPSYCVSHAKYYEGTRYVAEFLKKHLNI